MGISDFAQSLMPAHLDNRKKPNQESSVLLTDCYFESDLQGVTNLRNDQ